MMKKLKYFTMFILKIRLREIIWICHFSALFFLTFAIILPYLCQNVIYSSYYIEETKNEQIKKVSQLNKIRSEAAESYFKSISASEALSFHSRNNETTKLTLLITVITINRSQKKNYLSYLSQVMAKFNRELKSENNSNVSIFICNCDQNPEKFEEGKKMSRYFPVLLKSQFSVKQELESNRELNSHEIQKRDYTFCLFQAAIRQPKYILIVEDDGIPHDNFLSVLFYILSSKIENKILSGEMVGTMKNWAFLKLYYPEKWAGYSNNICDYLELTLLSLLGGCIFILIYYSISEYLGFIYHEFHFVIGCIYTFVIIYTIGKQQITDVRHLSKYFYYISKAPGCCTVATLYPGNIAKAIVSHLTAAKCNDKYAMDLVLDEFVVQNNLTSYLLIPNLFKHIGMYSTTAINPKEDAYFMIM